MMRRSLPLGLALALGACHETPHVTRPPRETAAAMSPGALPAAPLQGELAGHRFALRTAWMRVNRRAGHERLDLILSEGRPSRLCSRPAPADARQVVLRLRGVTAPPPVGTLRVETTDDAREVFAAVPGEHEGHGMAGVGPGAALVVVETSSATELTGRARFCLTDAHQSCVAGAFRATVCADELDLDGPRGGRDRAPEGGRR